MYVCEDVYTTQMGVNTYIHVGVYARTIYACMYVRIRFYTHVCDTYKFFFRPVEKRGVYVTFTHKLAHTYITHMLPHTYQTDS